MLGHGAWLEPERRHLSGLAMRVFVPLACPTEDCKYLCVFRLQSQHHATFAAAPPRHTLSAKIASELACGKRISTSLRKKRYNTVQHFIW